MRVYFDTSILLKTYLTEPGTPQALGILRATVPPVPFSHLLELEMRTAIRLKHGRQEISVATLRAALRALESDLAAGVLVRPDYDLDSVFRRAEILSAKHATAILARSADIWHVAAALEIGCTAFCSLDGRQRQLAALAKLKLLPA
jgi:predicted nucleic acid-binding protein